MRRYHGMLDSILTRRAQLRLRIADAHYGGGLVDGARVVGLFRLTFRNPADIIEEIRGEPVYLLAAMTADGMLRLKPQNLISGLPVRHEEAVN